MSRTSNRPNTSGKWAADDKMDEQLEALNILDDYIEFDNNYTYTEDDKMGSNRQIAQVYGFWLEDSDFKRYELVFVVYMELAESETVELQFPIEKENKGFINRNWELVEFLKMFGVTSDNIEDIIGRKVIYEDHRDKNTDSQEFGLTFYNSKKTERVRKSQKLSVALIIICTVSIIPAGFIGVSGLIAALGLLGLGVGVGGIDIVRRRLDRHGVISIKNYLIK